MSNRFAAGKNALAVCDVCGFTYKLRELRKLVIKDKDTNIKACPECWNPDQPQLKLGEFPIDDPQAVRDPRPDFAEYPQSRALILPLLGVSSGGSVGQVTVAIT